MANKPITQRKRLAAVFASFSILAVGTVSLCENMSLDYYSVLNTLQKIIPAAFAMGILGWFMGMVLDKPKRGHSITFNNDYFKKVIKEEINSHEDVGFSDITPDI